jgi:capsular exopolysaccharide synthesis family protein
MSKKNIKKLGAFEIPELRNASKTLLANIRFASVDEPVKSIVVTSTTPDEGKTATATNLACAIASAGLSVLVVDCDMRRRCIGSILNIHPAYGLYAVLSGEAKISDAVVETPYKNLFFLDCEPNIPSPPDLLSTHSFRALVKNLRGMYNYVILDAPPLTPFVDAAIISSVVDGTILCVREHATKRKLVEQSVAQLKAANARILGTVMTFTAAEQSDYYYAYYNAEGKRVRPGERTKTPAISATVKSKLNANTPRGSVRNQNAFVPFETPQPARAQAIPDPLPSKQEPVIHAEAEVKKVAPVEEKNVEGVTGGTAAGHVTGAQQISASQVAAPQAAKKVRARIVAAPAVEMVAPVPEAAAAPVKSASSERVFKGPQASAADLPGPVAVREERKVAPKKRGAGGFVATLFGRAMSAAGAGGAQVTHSATASAQNANAQQDYSKVFK